MRIPYAKIRPNCQDVLMLDDGNNLAYSEYGNPSGIPVIILHGGPGAGQSEFSGRLFDPELYKIILFDQRGCGRSKPHCQIESNTTPLLIQDILQLMQEFGIEKSVFYGGSWGATLALLFAQAYPERVLGIILRGTFLARNKDYDWLYGGGAGRIFPDYWQKFSQVDAEINASNMIESYFQLLDSDDELQRMSAAKQWSIWEARCATLIPNPQMIKDAGDPKSAMAMAVLSTHYFRHKSFIEENQILDNMHKIDHIPGYIVHGRYDMVCPLDNSFDLFSQWSHAELDIVRQAGHSEVEPGIIDAVIKATNKMSKRLGFESDQA